MFNYLPAVAAAARLDRPRRATDVFPPAHGLPQGRGDALDEGPAGSSCVSCDIQEGIPLCSGCPSSYYLFQQDGRLLLVFIRGTQQRIRINGTVEIMVLDVQEDCVQLGIVPTADVANCGDDACKLPQAIAAGGLNAEENLSNQNCALTASCRSTRI